jgi:hypothetical protein
MHGGFITEIGIEEEGWWWGLNTHLVYKAYKEGCFKCLRTCENCGYLDPVLVLGKLHMRKELHGHLLGFIHK